MVILSDSVGVDETLLHSSHIHTTCTRKHNNTSQGSYLAATLTKKFSQCEKFDCNLRCRSPSDA